MAVSAMIWRSASSGRTVRMTGKPPSSTETSCSFATGITTCLEKVRLGTFGILSGGDILRCKYGALLCTTEPIPIPRPYAWHWPARISDEVLPAIWKYPQRPSVRIGQLRTEYISLVLKQYRKRTGSNRIFQPRRSPSIRACIGYPPISRFVMGLTTSEICCDIRTMQVIDIRFIEANGSAGLLVAAISFGVPLEARYAQSWCSNS